MKIATETPLRFMVCLAAFVLVMQMLCSSSPGQNPPTCGEFGAVQSKPVMLRWNEDEARKYGMSVSEAQRYRAELIARAVEALITKLDFDATLPHHRRAVANRAMLMADSTLLQMGVLYEVEVKPEAAK